MTNLELKNLINEMNNKLEDVRDLSQHLQEVEKPNVILIGRMIDIQREVNSIIDKNNQLKFHVGFMIL